MGVQCYELFGGIAPKNHAFYCQRERFQHFAVVPRLDADIFHAYVICVHINKYFIFKKS